MSVKTLCVEPHPILRRKARPVEAFTDEIRRLARDLIETMYANDGIGIAAPQIGRDLRVFIANPSQRRGRELVLINPTLDGFQGRIGIVEGCLSVPDVWARVRRSGRVRVRGCDVRGRPVAVEAEGLLAVVLQHEFDHLEGRLFIDHLSWLRRRRLTKRLRAACA
jgi:peptide deformylase